MCLDFARFHREWANQVSVWRLLVQQGGVASLTGGCGGRRTCPCGRRPRGRSRGSRRLSPVLFVRFFRFVPLSVRSVVPLCGRPFVHSTLSCLRPPRSSRFIIRLTPARRLLCAKSGRESSRRGCILIRVYCAMRNLISGLVRIELVKAPGGAHGRIQRRLWSVGRRRLRRRSDLRTQPAQLGLLDRLFSASSNLRLLRYVS